MKDFLLDLSLYGALYYNLLHRHILLMQWSWPSGSLAAIPGGWSAKGSIPLCNLESLLEMPWHPVPTNIAKGLWGLPAYIEVRRVLLLNRRIIEWFRLEGTLKLI